MQEESVLPKLLRKRERESRIIVALLFEEFQECRLLVIGEQWVPLALSIAFVLLGKEGEEEEEKTHTKFESIHTLKLALSVWCDCYLV